LGQAYNNAALKWTAGNLLGVGMPTTVSPTLQLSIGDANTGLQQTSEDVLSIYTGGTARITADASGNVGIGTMSPVNKLHVNGDLEVNEMIVFDEEVVNSSSGSVTIDWNEGNRQYIAISGNITALNFTNPSGNKPGSFVLILVQGGSYTVSGWDSDIKWPGGTAPTITTGSGAIDVISCLYRYYSGSHQYLCVPSQEFQ
jgi:hypothetical protein